MGERHELNSDHISFENGHHVFVFASMAAETFDAQQLHTVAKVVSKERRIYLEKIITLLKRLERRTSK